MVPVFVLLGVLGGCESVTEPVPVEPSVPAGPAPAFAMLAAGELEAPPFGIGGSATITASGGFLPDVPMRPSGLRLPPGIPVVVEVTGRITREQTLLAGLALGALLCPATASAQVDEGSSPHLRNDCRLAAQILTTGEPHSHREWALERIRVCDESGAAALARVWAPPLPTTRIAGEWLGSTVSLRTLHGEVQRRGAEVVFTEDGPLGTVLADRTKVPAGGRPRGEDVSVAFQLQGRRTKDGRPATKKRVVGFGVGWGHWQETLATEHESELPRGPASAVRVASSLQPRREAGRGWHGPGLTE